MRRRFGHVLAVLACAAFLYGCSSEAGAPGRLISDVRTAVAAQDFAGGEALIETYRSRHGVTPEMLEALSWLGRGAQAAEAWDRADTYATETYDMSLDMLEGRSLDDEPHLPIARGAAMEVRAHTWAARGARSEAVAFLRRELETYRDTSLNKRIQKNINLLSMEGAPAPALDVSDHLGPPPPSLDALKGRVVILFFWAHWCPDCKAEGPILADLLEKYKDTGLTVVAPTMRYGYVAGGAPASAEDETRYIDEVRRASYPFLADEPVPLAEANHKQYGVSTTPTLVILDREGIVRLYHPGRMTADELEPLVQRLLAGG